MPTMTAAHELGLLVLIQATPVDEQANTWGCPKCAFA